MTRLERAVLAATLAVLLPPEAFAFGLVLQYEGPQDDRVAYFADVRTIMNRTPPDQLGGAIEIREIPVTAVYENASKPEFVHMQLQFRCPNRYRIDDTPVKLTENRDRVRAGDAVTFRIGSGSYLLRRSDLKTEPVPESDWKTSSAPALSRAGAVACNDIEIDQALHAAIKGKDFDFEGFGKRIATLNLPADTPVIGATLPSELLDFAWENLWWEKVLDHKRPDPTGRWSTRVSAADKQAALEKLQRTQQELESGTASLRAGLVASLAAGDGERKADLEEARNAGKHPDGSKMNKYEAKLMAAFKGQTERQVVDIMGNPEFSEVAGTRFLRYTDTWEKQGVTVYGAQGVVDGDAGGYAECFAEFTVRQDPAGDWRVVDVLVRADYRGAGLGRARLLCDDVTRPRSAR